MESTFDFSVMEDLIQKAMKDETGEMSKMINDLIMAGRKGGHSGMTLHEILCLKGTGVRKSSSVSIIEDEAE